MKIQIIIGLVLLFLILLVYGKFQISEKLPATVPFSESSDSIHDLKFVSNEFESEIEEMKKKFVEKGYEVISIKIGNYSKNDLFLEKYSVEDETICHSTNENCLTDKMSVQIEVKSFSHKTNQIWETLYIITSIEDAFVYRIEIISPTEICDILIFGEIWSSFAENFNYPDRDKIHQMMNQEICTPNY